MGRGGYTGSPRLGGLRNPPERQEGQGTTKTLSNWEDVGGMQTWCFTPAGLSGRVGLIARRHGLKPDWEELNVRNFRGGAGNVNEGRTKLDHRRLAQKHTR